MEQNAKLKKKQLIHIIYFNEDKTEKLEFYIYRTACRSKKKEYYLVVHRHTTGFDWKTLFREKRMVGYTIGEAVQALKQAIEKYATDVTINFLWIDKNLEWRAGILYTCEEKLEEHLEKLSKLDKDKKV